MKISSIKFHNLQVFKAQNKQVKVPAKQQTGIDKTCIYPAYNDIKIHKYSPVLFEYKPISSIKPDYEIFECDYQNLSEFSKKYAKKLNSQLMIVSNADVKKLADRIHLATNEPLETIYEVLYELTSFSSYNSLKNLEKKFQESGITRFGIDFIEGDTLVRDFSTNQNFNYLAKKSFLLLKFGDKKGIVLDDFFLSQLEESKKSTDLYKKQFYQEFLNEVKADNVTFFDIKGWDIKCSDGKYRSANMFCGSGFLESLAIDVIKRVKKGERLDSILYSDLSSRLKNILKDEELPNELDIVKIFDNQDFKKTQYDVAYNLNKASFSSDEIKNKLQGRINTFYEPDSCVEPDKIQEALLKYLNEFSIVFSVDSMSLALFELGKKIEARLALDNYGKNEVDYIVTTGNKSYGLITNMYAKINEIDYKNLSSLYYGVNPPCEQQKKRAKVILDDMSITGVSQNNACANLKQSLEKFNLDVPIYYATILSTPIAKDYAKKSKYINLINLKDAKMLGKSVDVHYYNSNYQEWEKRVEQYCAKNFRILSKEDCNLLMHNFDLGFLYSGLVCEFPYMLPDNNSQIANSLFSKHLYS